MASYACARKNSPLASFWLNTKPVDHRDFLKGLGWITRHLKTRHFGKGFPSLPAEDLTHV